MYHCSECGTELKGINFCPDCGADVSDDPDLIQNETTANTNSDITPCEQCNSQISTDAMKCPECRYEPASGIGAAIVGILALSVMLLSVLMLVTTPILVTDSFPISDGAIVFVLFGILAIISGYTVWAWHNQDQRKPTDSELSM